MAFVEKPGRTLPGGSRGELVSPCLDTILGGVVRWSCVIWCCVVWWCGVVVWCGGVVQWCGRMWWLVWCCGIVGGDEWLVVCTHLSRHGDAPHRRARLQLTLPSLPSTSTAVLQCPTWAGVLHILHILQMVQVLQVIHALQALHALHVLHALDVLHALHVLHAQHILHALHVLQVLLVLQVLTFIRFGEVFHAG